MSAAHDPSDLQRIYDARFSSSVEYRKRVWEVLCGDWFQRFVGERETILDLGSGYGEFSNAIHAGKKYAMDLNPDAPRHLGAEVEFLLQDCSTRWPLADGSLDVVFTSNFFEHLPDKATLGRTLDEIRRCLKPYGRSP